MLNQGLVFQRLSSKLWNFLTPGAQPSPKLILEWLTWFGQWKDFIVTLNKTNFLISNLKSSYDILFILKTQVWSIRNNDNSLSTSMRKRRLTSMELCVSLSSATLSLSLTLPIITLFWITIFLVFLTILTHMYLTSSNISLSFACFWTTYIWSNFITHLKITIIGSFSLSHLSWCNSFIFTECKM